MLDPHTIFSAPRDVPRETFIALRARREAYRIATDILYAGAVDVRRIECPACHSLIEPPPGTHETAVCGACGQRVLLPPHLRMEPHRDLTEAEAEARAEDVRLTLYAEAQAAREERRRTLSLIIALAMFIIVIYVVVYMASKPLPTPGAF